VALFLLTGHGRRDWPLTFVSPYTPLAHAIFTTGMDTGLLDIDNAWRARRRAWFHCYLYTQQPCCRMRLLQSRRACLPSLFFYLPCRFSRLTTCPPTNAPSPPYFLKLPHLYPSAVDGPTGSWAKPTSFRADIAALQHARARDNEDSRTGSWLTWFALPFVSDGGRTARGEREYSFQPAVSPVFYLQTYFLLYHTQLQAHFSLTLHCHYTYPTLHYMPHRGKDLRARTGLSSLDYYCPCCQPR